jgi:hypothetical protein
MSLPDRALELNFDPKKLKIKEIKALRNRETSLDAFCEVLARFSNWTLAETDELTIEELEKISLLVSVEVEKSTLPKAS